MRNWPEWITKQLQNGPATRRYLRKRAGRSYDRKAMLESLDELAELGVIVADSITYNTLRGTSYRLPDDEPMQTDRTCIDAILKKYGDVMFVICDSQADLEDPVAVATEQVVASMAVQAGYLVYSNLPVLTTTSQFIEWEEDRG